MDRGAWGAAAHGVAKSRTRLSDFTCTFHFHTLEKEMATHSSVLAWRIPGTGEPGGLLSMGSHRVGHDWSDLAAAVSVAARGLLSSCGTQTYLLWDTWHLSSPSKDQTQTPRIADVFSATGPPGKSHGFTFKHKWLCCWVVEIKNWKVRKVPSIQ